MRCTALRRDHRPCGSWSVRSCFVCRKHGIPAAARQAARTGWAPAIYTDLLRRFRAYAPDMDPTVAAAAIGVGGTVVVGVAGFWASVRNTEKTFAHARESRLWDRRAAVYVEALGAVNYRQARRLHEMQFVVKTEEQNIRRLEAYLAAYTPPDWYALGSRLLAFASEPVVTAVQVSSTAHEVAMRAQQSWQALDSMPHTGSEASLTQLAAAVAAAHTVGAALGAADSALGAAGRADNAAVELIRTEMQGRGQPLPDWRPVMPSSDLGPSR